MIYSFFLTMKVLVLLLMLKHVLGNLFDPGEEQLYIEYVSTSAALDEINKICQPAVEKITKIISGDTEETEIFNQLMKGDDPLIDTVKYLYEGSQSYNLIDIEYPDDEYDFIIVGAGAAGSVLANRLTEIPDVKVLLIEAGGDEEFYMDVPVLAFNLQKLDIDWQYVSKSSKKYCRGYDMNRCPIPRGKVMGGSTVINVMGVNRGSREDFDTWEALGNDKWSYNDTHKYFKKLETFNLPKRFDPKQHGYSGPLSIEQCYFRSETGDAFVTAAQEYGMKYIDYNGEEQCGISYVQLSLTNGTRHSANKAYLYPIRNRNNLHALKHSLATKIVFDDLKRAIGVSYERNNFKSTVYAKKEVIVSAGSINSPQLLMLSGLGPQTDLIKLGIPVIKDLPVGHNLIDHVTIPLTFRLSSNVTTITEETLKKTWLSLLPDFIKYHKGSLTYNVGEAVIYTNLWNNSTKAWPNIELLILATTFASVSFFKEKYSINATIYNQYFGPLQNQSGFTVYPIMLKPKSRGMLKLRSKNPHHHPIVDLNYFDNEDDIDAIVEAIKLTIDIINQPAMQKLGASLYEIPLERCSHYTFNSNDYWKCFIRTFTLSMFHISGTCGMGPNAVVDSRLRVHGVPGLRVVDASIFPEIPSAHIMVPVYMVAEKAADMIKEDWSLLTKH